MTLELGYGTHALAGRVLPCAEEGSVLTGNDLYRTRTGSDAVSYYGDGLLNEIFIAY